MAGMQRLAVDGADYVVALPDRDTDYIQGRIAREKQPYELDMLRDMARRITANDLVLDVGANIGNHTLYLAAVTGCRVEAFEPNPELCDALRESIRANHQEGRVRVHCVGVGAAPGVAHFVAHTPDNLGAQALAPGASDDERIEIVRLDDLDLQGPVAALKIDVEGMEAEVLRGAAELIRRDRPSIYVECRSEADFNQIYTVLSQGGYVYSGTFNATPTHCFVYQDHLEERAVLDEARRIEVLRQHYRQDVAAVELTKKLEAANRKYREANQRIDVLKEKLESANRKYRDVSASLAHLKRSRDQRDLEKRSRITPESENDLAREREFEQLQSELEGVRSRLHQSIQEQERLQRSWEESEHALERAQSRIAELELDLGEQVSRLQQREGLLGELRLKAREAGERHRLDGERIATLERELRDVHGQLEAERQSSEAEQGRLRLQADSSLREVEGLRVQLLSMERDRSELNRRNADLDDARRALIQELETSVRALDEMRDRHRSLQIHADSLQSSLDASGKEQAARAEQEDILRQKLHQANLKYREASRELVALKRQTQEERDQHGRQLLDRSSRLEAANLRYREASEQLARLRRSRAQRLASAIRAAWRYPRDALRLPLVILRILRSPVHQNQRGAAHSEEDDSSPAVLPVSKSMPALDVSRLKGAGLRQLRVACIMDDFTFRSFQHECDLYPLTPGQWQSELESVRPELLLIESAWRGKDELWGSKVGHTSEELRGVVTWCRQHAVPAAFWNKEDPVHFETFLNTARLFDVVFTTDLDCISRYKAALGHEQVYLLPFACQPAMHNPIETHQREDAFCFAGAYYVRYPERTRDLESFVRELPGCRPVVIYDRNHEKNDPDYKFPEIYRPYIIGTLPFDQIDRAYKGYRYAINLNSIKQSQTMFARRVYELLACNTLTVSNYSRGLRLMFGDLVLASDSGTEIRRRLEALEASGNSGRLRLAALRKIMLEHTYAERLRYVVEKISGTSLPDALPSFRVMGRASNVEELRALVAHVGRQRGVEVALSVLLCRGLSLRDARVAVAGATVAVDFLSRGALRRESLASLAQGAGWISGMLADDYYGPSYLLDCALATRYSAARVVGKQAHHIWKESGCTLVDSGAAYQSCDGLPARRAVIHHDAVSSIPAARWFEQLAVWRYEHPTQLAIDAYSYCAEGGQAAGQVSPLVDDLALDSGMTLHELQRLGEAIAPAEHDASRSPLLDATGLVALLQGKDFKVLDAVQSPAIEVVMPLKLSKSGALDLQLEHNVLKVTSDLPDGKHEYIYARKDLSPQALWPGWEAGRQEHSLDLHLDMEPGLNLSLVVLFLDQDGQRLGHVIEPANRNLTLTLPEGTVCLRLGLRIYAAGTGRIRRLMLGHLDLEPQAFLGQSDVLLLTNHYPSYNDLYRNGFVHTRVRAYRERGVKVDVFRLRPKQSISWHEFQDIDVTTGSKAALRRMLESGRYRHVLVHFLDPDMWEVLKDFIDRIRVTVWVHGAEIHPWYRRRFNIETPDQEAQEIEKSDKRMAFWRSVLNPVPAKLHLVFVSNYFAFEVMEDIGFELPKEQYSIIPNPINTELFSYIEKPPEQRRKILSIRPFSSKQYANDISVKAIQELTKYDFFNDLDIRIIGDGKLFEETVVPIKDYPNVTLERRFVTQQEIAALHKEYGIFLCPTRWDSQGVSRDEAMSSGLVVATTNIAAIPEFADETCAILAPAENATELAKGIAELQARASLFKNKSKDAKERTVKQVGFSKIIPKELAIFK